MHLLAAPMLFGLVLASVPIIIHLWNRRRFRVVEWAPMRYLKLTIKTNRKRMRIEQILLLTVRTLLIVLLFAALARPALSKAGLGGWLASRARSSRIMVIDDSLSMNYQADRKSAFEIAKDAASEIIRTIGAQDSITIVLATNPDHPMVRDVSLSDRGNILRDIAKLTPTDAATDWASVFKRVDDYFTGMAHPQKELIILTDMRQSGWTPAVSTQTNRWASQSIDVKAIDAGSRQTDNIVLTRFEQEDPLALPGAPLKLHAAVRNDSAIPIHGAQASLEIDGQARPLVLPDLAAGRATELPLTVTIPRPGQHVLKLTLNGADPLAADNSRWLAASVRADVRVLLIDGQISSRPFESSTDFLQVAFTVGSEPWLVTRRSDTEWKPAGADAQLSSEADVIAIANAAALSQQQVAALEKLVAAGTGLMIFAGEQSEAAVYEQLMHRAGAGVLPGQISRSMEAAANGLAVEPFSDSPLAMLGKIAPEALARIRPKRVIPVSIDSSRDRDVRVLARWNDSEAHPAAIEKRFGRGRVILWTISADRQWSDWPVDPTYVLAMRSAAMAIARADAAGNNFTAGSEIAIPLEPNQVVRNPTITPADPAVPQPLAMTDQVMRYESTRHAGKYQIGWRDVRDAEQSRILCASFDVAESNLAPIAEGDLTNMLTPLRPTYIHWSADGGGSLLAERGREIWRNIVIGLLMLAAVETVLAMWVGRER